MGHPGAEKLEQTTLGGNVGDSVGVLQQLDTLTQQRHGGTPDKCK